MNQEKKIKILLANLGLSKSDLARMLTNAGYPVSIQNLNQKMKRNTLSFDDMEHIARVLGVRWIAEFWLSDGTKI